MCKKCTLQISTNEKDFLEEKELTPEATHKKYLSVRKEGNRDIQRLLDYYNLNSYEKESSPE